MSARWQRHHTETLYVGRHVRLHVDEVTNPGGGRGPYEWVETTDLVRVAAVTTDGQLYVVQQHHYLTGRYLWQLPGGQVEAGEAPAAAAARELTEETGLVGTLRHLATTWPMPGLTPARVHLYSATMLAPTDSTPDPEEADLTVQCVDPSVALQALHNGLVADAASAALLLTQTGLSY